MPDIYLYLHMAEYPENPGDPGSRLQSNLAADSHSLSAKLEKIIRSRQM